MKTTTNTTKRIDPIKLQFELTNKVDATDLYMMTFFSPVEIRDRMQKLYGDVGLFNMLDPGSISQFMNEIRNQIEPELIDKEFLTEEMKSEIMRIKNDNL